MTAEYIGKRKRRGPRVRTYVMLIASLAVLMAGGIVALQHYHVGIAAGHDHLSGNLDCAGAFESNQPVSTTGADGSVTTVTPGTPGAPAMTVTSPAPAPRPPSAPGTTGATTSTTADLAAPPVHSIADVKVGGSTTQTTVTAPDGSPAGTAQPNTTTPATTPATPAAPSQPGSASHSGNELPPGAQGCVTLRLRWDGNQAVITDINLSVPGMHTNAVPTGEAHRGGACTDGALRAPRSGDVGGPCSAALIDAGAAVKLDTGLLGDSILRRHGFGSYDLIPLGVLASGPYSFTGMSAIPSNTTGSVEVTMVNGSIRLVMHGPDGHRFELSPTPGQRGHQLVVRFYLVTGPAAISQAAGAAGTAPASAGAGTPTGASPPTATTGTAPTRSTTPSTPATPGSSTLPRVVNPDPGSGAPGGPSTGSHTFTTPHAGSGSGAVIPQLKTQR